MLKKAISRLFSCVNCDFSHRKHSPLVNSFVDVGCSAWGLLAQSCLRINLKSGTVGFMPDLISSGEFPLIKAFSCFLSIVSSSERLVAVGCAPTNHPMVASLPSEKLLGVSRIDLDRRNEFSS